MGKLAIGLLSAAVASVFSPDAHTIARSGQGRAPRQAWAENMSVSAIAREAFDAYLAARRKAVGQARELRDSFGRKREAV